MPIIRVAKKEDAQDILNIYGPIAEESPITFEIQKPSLKDMSERIEQTLISTPWLVAEEEDRVVAYAYAGEHRKRIAYQWAQEVSVYVHSEFQGQGIAKELYIKLFKILERQNFYMLYAVITLPNEASVGLHEALGFENIGVHKNAGFKLGRWHDVGWWELRLNEKKMGAPRLPSDFLI